jgi:urease accessory protein
MGQTTTRITAQDFVTPPELHDYSLAANGAGRIGGVRLHIASDGTKSYLAGCYQQVPLRVLPLAFGPHQPALFYLLNPTAGLFDGDAQRIDVHAGASSRAIVTGQSATRIHPCLHGYSTQQWHIRVEAGAILVILPGPALPFQRCRYFQRALVDLAEGAHIIWGDLWLPGRYERGADSERFQFHAIVQDLTVRRRGRLIFRDRFCWRGPWDEATADWHFGGEVAYGTLFTTIGEPTGASPRVPEELGEHPEYREAQFQTAEKHTCRRWLGPAQAVTAALAQRAFTLAGHADGQTEPWLLATHDLAPTHWFSPNPLSERSSAAPLKECEGQLRAFPQREPR